MLKKPDFSQKDTEKLIAKQMKTYCLEVQKTPRMCPQV